MAQKTDLNVAPYYDDFDSTDNFHKILFRPGFAVQARELTQSQTILQNQVERFGEHMFKDGTIVKGAQFTDTNVKFAKLNDANTSSVSYTHLRAHETPEHRGWRGGG